MVEKHKIENFIFNMLISIYPLKKFSFEIFEPEHTVNFIFLFDEDFLF